jgi:hypothetical protein
MTLKYTELVPWGRSFDEYCRMFVLTPEDLKKRILGCGDGPASFNVICSVMGGSTVSVDPIYALTKEQIAERVRATYDDVISQTARNKEMFRWNLIKSVDELGKVRMTAMNRFLADYELGKATGRYVAGSLPVLDFPDDSFDISLSGHFLLFHVDNLSFDFHVESIEEMLRVSREARIFPLVDVNGQRSPYVDGVISRFQSYRIEIREVPYEFQVGGNEMMVISREPAAS